MIGIHDPQTKEFYHICYAIGIKYEGTSAPGELCFLHSEDLGCLRYQGFVYYITDTPHTIL